MACSPKTDVANISPTYPLTQMPRVPLPAPRRRHSLIHVFPRALKRNPCRPCQMVIFSFMPSWPLLHFPWFLSLKELNYLPTDFPPPPPSLPDASLLPSQCRAQKGGQARELSPAAAWPPAGSDTCSLCLAASENSLGPNVRNQASLR